MTAALLRSITVAATNTHASGIATRHRSCRAYSVASASTIPIRSPSTIWSRVRSGMARPYACAENSCRATWRKAWIHSSGVMAAPSATARIRGTAYQAAAVA
jgi:hypothetical protein